MGAVDLSADAIRARKAVADGVFEETVEDGADRVEAADPENGIKPPVLVEADFAFLVLSVNGEILVTPELNTAVVTRRYPTADDITGAGANLLRDRAAETTIQLAAQVLPEMVAEATVAAVEAKQAEAIRTMQEKQLEAQARAALAAEQGGAVPPGFRRGG